MRDFRYEDRLEKLKVLPETRGKTDPGINGHSLADSEELFTTVDKVQISIKCQGCTVVD